MVRKPWRYAAILALSLSLAACLFVLSPFPATLPQVLARVDLSTMIPSAYANQYQPFIVTPTGGEFVLLINNSGSVDPAVIVFDPKLKIIQTYTQSQLTTWGFNPSGSAMTDANGHVAFRNGVFFASDLKTVNQPPSGGFPGMNVGGAGFSSPNGLANEINFQGGTTLSYSLYNQFWGSLGMSTPVAFDGSGGSYYVQAIYDVNDNPAAGEVVLAINQSSSSNMVLVSIPLVNILTNSIASPILSNYPNKRLQNIDSSSVGFAGDSIVAYSHDSHSLNRYSLSTFSEMSSLSSSVNNSQNDNPQYAYKMTGGYSVVYDPATRTLTKVANWW